MQKHFVIFLFVIIVIIGAGACTKKSEAPEESPLPQREQEAMPPGHGGIEVPPESEMKVIIPENIKGKWTGVILTVVDRQAEDARDYTLSRGQTFSIPDSTVDIRPGEFLPDLKVDGNIYTTTSSELLNPAIHVLITEDGQEIFQGWLFQKFPSVHPFKHQRFAITLKQPVAAF